MKIGLLKTLVMMENNSNEFLPYLILHELADVEAFKVRMKKEEIDFVLEWRYYYGYNDAIRIIDFVETKGIYDAWAVLLPKACQAQADKLVVESPTILKYFEPAEASFFRGLKTEDLEKSLASKQMTGCSLALALKILKEQNITYSANEIQALKEELALKNAKKVSNLGRTKAFIWCIILVTILAYLWLIGMFEF
jgi:hypothetical protein